jgi:hypothetical protein
MIKVYSHINSSSHFDSLWNDQIDRFAKYFTYSRNLAFAYHFKQTAFITKLYEAVITDTVSDISEQDLAMFMEANCDLSQLAFVYKSYETKKKNIKPEKIALFVEQYDALAVSEKNTVRLPTSLDFYALNIFYGLYPSVRSSFVEFLLSQSLVSYNTKFCYLELTKYKCNIQDIAHINVAASHSKILNFNTNINLKDVFEKVDDLISSLQKDKYYLEEHIVVLSKAIDDLNGKLKQQQQEGINGYLLTWH